MTEKTIELDFQLLLPGVDQEDDACLARLESALQDHKGLQRAHLESDKQPVCLCLHYDPAAISLAEVKRLAERAGAKIVNRYHHAVVPIEGMDCSDCVTVIEHSVGRIEGVLKVSVNYAAEQMHVEFDAHKTDRAAIEKRVRSLGYAIPASGLHRQYLENRELLFSLFSGLLLLVGWLGGRFLGLPALVSLSFYLAAYALGGWTLPVTPFTRCASGTSTPTC